MKQYIAIALLAIASTAFAAPGFVVKFGLAGLTDGYHYVIPREVSSLNSSWSQVARPDDDDLLSCLDMYCFNDDYSFCVYYDDLGYVAGCQVSIPVANVTDTIPTDLADVGFKTWTPSGSSDSYYMHQQFFVSEATLSLTTEERQSQHDSNLTLYDGGVWVTDYNHELLYVSSNATDMSESVFTEQACFAGMGMHYFYNMTTEADPDKLFPWFLLVEDGELVATGFGFLGILPTPTDGSTNWFEHPTAALVKAIAPYGPETLYEYAADPGVVTMHIYYVEDPSAIAC